jgi:hypothetical protein
MGKAVPLGATMASLVLSAISGTRRGAIDPRSLTQLFPIFGSSWIDAFKPLPSGNLQVYGAGLSIALTDRLSFGLTQVE